MIYDGPLSEVPLFRYDLIMANPDWSFENWSEKGWGKAPQRHYACSPLEELKAIAAADLATLKCRSGRR